MNLGDCLLLLSPPSTGIDLDKDSMKTVYEKFGLEPGTQDFIGHAMALYLDDESVFFFWFARVHNQA